MPIKIAINGFGRIGRPTLRRILDSHSDLEVVAINDLTDPQTMAHLLKYDSVYGIYKKAVKAIDGNLFIDGAKITILAEKDPANLPWKDMEIDIVLECTGAFTSYDKAKGHLEAGAKKVIISAPSKDPDQIPSYILGVNEEKFDAKKADIMDMGSCTTNCLAPVAKVLNDNFKIVKGFMTTVHAYTNDQNILDLSHKDLRRARAAGLNIIPTSTGAAKALGRVLPELEGKLEGIAMRVPIPTVSIVDLICQTEKETTAEEVNFTLKKASQNAKLNGILGVEDALLVSSDYIGNSYSAIVDSENTKVIGGNLVKLLIWYDNEWAYACRYAQFAELVGKKL